MGRPYDHKYHYAPSGCRSGTMVCPACGKPIDDQTQDFRAYKRTRNGDWGFVTHHRECCANDPMWEARDKQRADEAAAYQQLQVEAAAFAAKWSQYGYDFVGAVQDAANAQKPAVEWWQS